MPEYKVNPGDCISSIAESHGLFWEKVWNHPKNARLKEQRQDPNILCPGDVIFVPEKEKKEESGATEQKHRFRKKGTPAKLRVRILQEVSGEQQETNRNGQPYDPRPRANIPYVLDIDGNLTNGKTDAEGWIEHSIPPNAKQARLIMEPGTPNEVIMPFRLGHLDPVSEISGIQHRLNNMGFPCGPANGVLNSDTQDALRRFQEKNGLQPTGEINDATRAKLAEIHTS
jgi:hypothetical protein